MLPLFKEEIEIKAIRALPYEDDSGYMINLTVKRGDVWTLDLSDNLETFLCPVEHVQKFIQALTSLKDLHDDYNQSS